MIWFIKRLSVNLPREALLSIYKSFIRLIWITETFMTNHIMNLLKTKLRKYRQNKCWQIRHCSFTLCERLHQRIWKTIKEHRTLQSFRTWSNNRKQRRSQQKFKNDKFISWLKLEFPKHHAFTNNQKYIKKKTHVGLS